MNNKYEVGVTPDDNNDIRLPGSVQPEAQRGDSAYHHLEMAKAGPLDAKSTGGMVGMVGMPTVGVVPGMPNMNANVDMTNSDTTLMATASTENLSRKYKYPNVSVDMPEKARGQFADHS